MQYDPYDPAVIADPYPYYAWLRDEAPLYRMQSPAAWVLSRHEDVATALRRPEPFSSAHGVAFGEGGGGGTLVAMDPPDHTRLRRILSSSFTPRVIAELEPDVVALTDTLLDGMAGAGEVDVVASLAAPLPTQVIAALLGIDVDRWQEYKWWSDTLNAASWARDQADRMNADFMRAAMEAGGFFTAELERRRSAPTGDLISLLVKAQQESDAASDQEIIGFCILLLLAGNVTTTSLIANGLATLADHPDEFVAVRDNAAAMPAAVEEMVRFESPIQGFCRTLASDVELHGETMRAGDQVFVLFAAANRDPRVFESADRFDPSRHPNPHLGFGTGPHLCLGAPLARLEAKVVLERLLPRLDAIERSDEPIVRAPVPAFRDVDNVPLRLKWR